MIADVQRFEIQNAKIGQDFGILVVMAFLYRLFYYFVMQYFRTGKR
jgi:hypothetical protein